MKRRVQQPLAAEKGLTISKCSNSSEMKVWATLPGRPPTQAKVIAGAKMNVERTVEAGADEHNFQFQCQLQQREQQFTSQTSSSCVSLEKKVPQNCCAPNLRGEAELKMCLTDLQRQGI